MTARWGKAVSSVAEANEAAAAGFDCAAVDIEYVMAGGDEQFALQKNLFQQCKLAPEVCLSVLPANVSVAEKGFNLYYWMDYLKQATDRLAALGCGAIVWRNGAARALPPEGDQSAAKEQTLQFVYMLCHLCESRGIRVMIEPLAKSAANYLNTAPETEEFIAQVGKTNLHLAVGAEAADETSGGMPLNDIASRARHVCIKNAPAPPNTPPFFAALQNAGYQGVVSVVGKADKKSLQHCRSLFG